MLDKVKINLGVRIKQKWFWLTLIPMLFILGDQVAQLVNTLNTIAIGGLYGSHAMALALDIVGVVFAILALIGFPVDLTTDGYGDSARALGYTMPAPNASDTAKEMEDVKPGGTE